MLSPIAHRPIPLLVCSETIFDDFLSPWHESPAKLASYLVETVQEATKFEHFSWEDIQILPALQYTDDGIDSYVERSVASGISLPRLGETAWGLVGHVLPCKPPNRKSN